MIGTKIKGFRHLFNLAKASKKVNFFFKHDNINVSYACALYVDGKECKNPYMSSASDYIMIFNNYMSNVKFNFDYHRSAKNSAEINDIFNRLPCVWVIPVDIKKLRDESITFSNKVVVPEDFDKKYSEFCEANKKQMPNATKYSSIHCDLFKYIFAISNGSKNFFFWAVNAYFKQGMSIYLLENILRWNDKYSQLTKNLKKGTITGYTNSNDFFALVRELTLIRRNKRANDVINMFNTAQKKALKEVKLSDRDYDTLSKFGKISSKKKNNFIRKMSTVDDPIEILKQMSFLADVHFEWKKESLLDFIKNTENFNCEVIIDRDDIVLLKVNDYETVKRLAKTTNWCISKDKKYWIEYVEHNPMATQYVLFDFSRKEDDNLSIIGFTSVHDRGITNAHDFQNRNLMQGRRSSAVSEIKSFVSKFIDCSNIYGVLDKYGIKLSDVVSYEPSQYEWNRENMFKYLEQCIDEDDYYIVADYGDKVAFIVDNDNVRYFLGDAYIEQRNRNKMFGNQHIIFADFTKKQNDPEKIIFGLITHNFETHESSCARLFNERFDTVEQSFDSKLEEYGLPYDIICRKNNVVERFYSSLSNLELATTKDLIKEKDVLKSLKNKDNSGLVCDSITNVTFAYNSCDYINLFYDNGICISEIIGARAASDLARRMIITMFDFVRNGVIKSAFIPTESDLKDFYSGKINDYANAMYIGNFVNLSKMVANERDNEFLLRLVMGIFDFHNVCDLFDLFMTIIFDKLCGLNKITDAIKYVVAYAFNLKSPRVINAIHTNKNKSREVCELVAKQKIPFKITTSEMWVSRGDGVYAVENIEEIAAHAPSKR